MAVLTLVLLVPAGPTALHGGSGKQVKVILESRQSGVGVVVEGTERKVTRSTGIFTIVQDGGESTLLVARVRVTPTISWFADDRSGAIEVREQAPAIDNTLKRPHDDFSFPGRPGLEEEEEP